MMQAFNGFDDLYQRRGRTFLSSVRTELSREMPVMLMLLYIGCITAQYLDAAYCYKWHSMVYLCTCLSIGHVHEPCKQLLNQSRYHLC